MVSNLYSQEHTALDEIEQFSDDEDCNDDYLPSLSVEESNMLFYRPSGKWADLGECPIEDPIVLAKLHCE